MAVITMNNVTAYSKDAEPDIEDVIQGNIKSMGSPETVEGITIRGIGGTALVEFIQGGTGRMQGQAMFLSEKKRLGIVMKFGATDYPGEYFAFDGKKVMANQISPGQRSPLADFIYRYGALVKEGVLGGVLSLNWPLLDLKNAKSVLKYKGIEKIDGKELYEVEYNLSDRKLNNLKIKLYFEQGTFRHVRTEYSLSVRGEMGLQANAVVIESGMPSSTSDLSSGGSVRAGSIQDIVPDSHYILIEKFSDFKEVDGLTLPHRYDLEYSLEGQGSSFLANWTILASQFMHTGKVDESFYKADE
jgi:hypothetical protein